MFASIYKTAVTSTLLAGLLISCSDIDRQAIDPQKARDASQFSPEEKRIARSLSISNNALAPKIETPYGEAILCSYTIESLVDRLRELRSVNSEVVKAGEQAKAIFDRRLKAIAENDGKSAEAIKSDFDVVASENTDPSTNARSAMACLQKLQN